MNKIETLEGEVAQLTGAKQQLMDENQSLQREIEKLRFQLQLQAESGVEQEDSRADDPFPAITKLENLGGPKTAVLFTPGGTFSLTPLQTGTVFNFPTLAEVKTVDDNTQFSKTLAAL